MLNRLRAPSFFLIFIPLVLLRYQVVFDGINPEESRLWSQKWQKSMPPSSLRSEENCLARSLAVTFATGVALGFLGRGKRSAIVASKLG